MPEISPYLPYLAYALPFVVGFVALAVRGRLQEVARETVAAVYRLSIRTASELQEDGIAWLRSDEGVTYRKKLAEAAYDALPDTLAGVPLRLVKLLLTRERFCALVEAAFCEVVQLAERLEFPPAV